MARSRGIKPSFFLNETLTDLPFEYRLLFIGLWTLADRDGRLEDRPKRIKMALFPADDVDCDAGVDALASAGFLVRYAADGDGYIQITNFSKHQNPHPREAASVIPPLTQATTKQRQGTTKATPRRGRAGQGLLTPSSLTPSSDPTDHAAKRGLQPEGVPDQVWQDFLTLRRSKRAPVTATAIDGIADEARKAGVSLAVALATCCVKGWQGYDATWVGGKTPPLGKYADVIAGLTGRRGPSREVDMGPVVEIATRLVG